MIFEEGDTVEAEITVIEDAETVIRKGTSLKVITRAPFRNSPDYVYWLGKNETAEYCFFQSEMDFYFRKVENATTSS